MNRKRALVRLLTSEMQLRVYLMRLFRDEREKIICPIFASLRNAARCALVGICGGLIENLHRAPPAARGIRDETEQEPKNLVVQPFVARELAVAYCCGQTGGSCVNAPEITGSFFVAYSDRCGQVSWMFELWTEAVRSIEPMVKPAHRDLWLRPIECVGIDDGRIRLRAPNRYHKEWFEDNFLPSILKDLEARAQRPFTVDFEVVEEDAVAAGHVPACRSTRTPGHASAPPRATPPPELVSRYTFDKFVVGPTNQFAHAAARMVAEAPASRWNPLFIYGGVGLGKTHLLHAIGHEIHHQHPEWAITFMTCEKFVTDFIGSMMRQKSSAARRWRTSARATGPRRTSCSIDDIQFLSNKDSSQDEFFHTFNALHYAHKQIVLTSDKLPAELPGVEDRLRSRFTWGLIAEVETPDLETRVAILKRKAEVEKVNLPDEVALYLAAHIKTQRPRAGGRAAAPGGARVVPGPGDLDRAGARRAGQAASPTRRPA